MMRTILAAKGGVGVVGGSVMGRLVECLHVVCKNPSNPNFNHFLFESISAMVRYDLF
jgi:exportin-2 (importin alpha re-exporter)